MAFEKGKVLKAAEKFLSQGNINAAIVEYRQIVEHEESDFTTLNMLGDLCVRAGRKDEAIACFSRIAEHYREQEFALKAIAMYKKIDRLTPRNPTVAEKLADLYSSQRLVVDARAQYLVVADAYTRAGDSKRAVEILHKIADLDPHNTEVRLKLAESYLKEGLQSEAAQAFTEAGRRLYEVGAYEKSLNAYSRALELRPYQKAALSGLVSSHAALGTAYEAAELLEKLIAQKPDDVELIALLLQAQLAASDAAGAERATSLLLAQDASHYTRFLDVARLYLTGGDADSAARVLAGITERALAGREENELRALIDEVLDRNPEQLTALRLLVRVFWWQRDMEKLRAALERLAEAAEAAKSEEDERYALTQLVRLLPDATRYAVRLKDLGGAQEDLTDDAKPPVGSLDEVPTFEDFAIVTPPDTDASHSTVGMVAEIEFNTAARPTVSDPSASFAELSDEYGPGARPAAESEFHSATPKSDPGEIDFGGTIVDASSASAEAAYQTSSESERHKAILRQELESVDFYIAQGYADIALDTLELLERQFQSHPDIEARRRKLSALSGSAQPAKDGSGTRTAPPPVAAHLDITSELVQEEEVAAVVASRNSKRPAAKSSGTAIDEGLADIFEEFRVAEEEDKGADYETHFNMGIAYKEMDLLDEAVREFQAAAGLINGSDGTPRFLECCNLLGHCFMQKGLPKAAVLWFKKGLAAPNQSEDQYQALRYELGLAFEHMGEIGKAIDTFTEVYSVDVSYRGVGEKLKELQAQKNTRKKRR